jgi:hypothetical protein
VASPVKINFKIYQGSTFKEIFRWETSTKTYANISSVTKTAPAVITTTAAHNIPVGWRVKITNVGGMKEINDSNEYRLVTSAGTNTLTLNEINAVGYSTYTSGGVVEYNQPVDLTGYTARMQIRPTIESGIVISSLTTENSKLEINSQLNTITILIPALETTGFTFQTAVYSLELIKNSEVIPFCNGNISLIKEVTR